MAENAKKKPSSPQRGDDNQQHAPSSSAIIGHEDQKKKNKRLSPATTIREISNVSDLQRLERVLDRRKVNTCCRETFAAALRDGNPAIVDMWLRHGKDHKGASFLEAFRSWGEAGVVAGGVGVRSAPASLPLHLSCHAGSPEIVSVLLQFIAEAYSSKDREAMLNARDLNGRTALHLASWSPRLQCPGKRNDIVRSAVSTWFPHFY